MQNEFKVRINTIDRAKLLAKICEGFDEDIDLGSGRYIIDARSILGIFSFDLTKDLNIKIHSDDNEVIKRFNEEMRELKSDD